jgi:hypothetical protein
MNCASMGGALWQAPEPPAGICEEEKALDRRGSAGGSRRTLSC